MIKFLFCQTLIDYSTGDLEMNFGEYEFVYPDGEVDTTPTTGKSAESLNSDHALFSKNLTKADCSCGRCS